ncbi:MAG TPA: DUF3577 domain-containing protein [Zoogloea sp.]|jgi:hypothetical protein|nr:DUF3577 domain-containing protein [Zoogloea sp.]
MQTQPQYFDLHTSGIGYMSRLRLVQPDKSKGQKFKPFWSVSISAICGEENDVKYVKFDLNIKGDQAKQAMDVLKPYLIDDEGKSLDNKVLVGFRVGDAIPEIYTVTKEGKPEQRVCLKGRLLKLTSAKVNGQVVELPKTEHDEAKEAGAAQAAQSAE